MITYLTSKVNTLSFSVSMYKNVPILCIIEQYLYVSYLNDAKIAWKTSITFWFTFWRQIRSFISRSSAKWFDYFCNIERVFRNTRIFTSRAEISLFTVLDERARQSVNTPKSKQTFSFSFISQDLKSTYSWFLKCVFTFLNQANWLLNYN